MFKRLIIVVALLVAGLIAVMLWRTGQVESIQPEPLTRQPPGEVRPGAAERLAEALSFPTITRAERGFDESVHQAFLDWLVDTYSLAHQTLQPEHHGDYSLLFRWPGSDRSLNPALLMAHYDVVPVEPGTEDEWTYPPFAGTIADGHVWGRGALDNKSGVTGILEAVESLLAADFQPERTVLIAFGHDEEIAGRDGALAIAEQLLQEGVELAWVLDEGGAVVENSPMLDGPVAMIGTAEKGYISLRLTARAPGGHSSQPPPQTAVGILAGAIDRVQNSPWPVRMQPPVTDTLQVLAAEGRWPQRVMLANRWVTGALVRRQLAAEPHTHAWLRTTIAPTMLAAGDKDNVLPQRAEGVINFRLLPGDSVAEVRQRVADLVDDERVTIEVYGRFEIEPSAVSPVDDDAYARIAGAIREVWPEVRVVPYLLTAATDSRHFAPMTGRIYRFLPVRVLNEDITSIHGTDERVAIDGYIEGIEVYRMLIADAGRHPD